MSTTRPWGERRMLQFFKKNLPENCLVFPSFIIYQSGRRYEVDGAILGPRAIYLIEDKFYSGEMIEVSEQEWQTGVGRRVKNPLPFHELKAKIFKTNMEGLDPTLKSVYVYPLVTVSGDEVTLDMSMESKNYVKTLLGAVELINSGQGIPKHFDHDITHLHERIRSTMFSRVHTPEINQFGDYDVIEKLDDSSFEYTLYRAINRLEGTGRKYLLKVYHLDFTLDKERFFKQYEFYKRDLLTLSQLQYNSHIIHFNTLFELDEHLVAVYSDPGGRTLEDLYMDGISLSWEQKLNIIRQVLQTVDFIHTKGIIHRNLGAGSILLLETGDSLLQNFDCARVAPEISGTVSSLVINSLDQRYLAPELAINPSGANQLSDLFSLGIVFYELLSEDYHFQQALDFFSSGVLVPIELPENLTHLMPVLQKMAAWRPEDRYQSAREVLNELKPLLNTTINSITHNALIPATKIEYQEGELINNRYRVESYLGQGAFSRVYKVYDIYNPVQPYALKIMKSNADMGTTAVREFNILQSLHHDNVARAIFFEPLSSGHFLLILEYVDGEPLNHWWSGKEYNAQLVDQLLQLTEQVLLGLDVIHKQGLIHGDIKPDNILVIEDAFIKLVDFNISGNIEHETSVAGTQQYLAPDVGIEGRHPGQDLFALGVTIYQLLFSQHPYVEGIADYNKFPGTPANVPNFISNNLLAFILKACQPKLVDRFTNAEEMLQDLRQLKLIQSELVSSLLTQATTSITRKCPEVVEWINQLCWGAATVAETNEARLVQEHLGLDVDTLLYSKDPGAENTLRADILSGRKTLIILTGNAGDGKTHFINNILKDLQDRPHSLEMDASARSEEQLLEWFREAMANQGKVSIIAINEGRLRYIAEKMLQDSSQTMVGLSQNISDALKGKEAFADTTITLVNLNQRAVVHEQIFGQIINCLINPQHWQKCQNCSSPCNILENVRRLSNPLIRERIRLLFTYIYLKGFHLTMRSIITAISYTITGGKNPEENPNFYYDNLFYPDNREAPLVFQKLRELDPAKGSHNELDTAMYFAIKREVMEQRWVFPCLPEEMQLPEEYLVRHLRRKTYFEAVDEEVQEQLKSFQILPFRYIGLYLDLINGKVDTREALSNIILALNRLDDPSSNDKTYLNIWETPNLFGLASTRYAIRRARESRKYFSLKPVHCTVPYLETMPREMTFVYNQKISFNIDLSLFEIMMLAANGFTSKQIYGSHLPRIQAFKEKLMDEIKNQSINPEEVTLQVFVDGKPSVLNVFLDGQQIDVSRG